jgi:ornithine cyclodeaminase
MIRILREADLKAVLDVPTGLDVIERLWSGYGRGERFSLSQPTSLFGGSGERGAAKYKVKGATLPARGVTGLRLVGDAPVEHGFKSSHMLVVYDDRTGVPIGLIDELWLHRFRTALTGVVAARHLARPDSKVVALIGAGAIARELFPALTDAFALDEVRVVARRLESATTFCNQIGAGRPARFTPMRTAGEAVAGADIVITLTFADSPVIHPGMLAPGSFLCSMGETEEIDIAVLDEIDRFVVDEFEYATLLGDISIWLKEGRIGREALKDRMNANIGEIVAGTKPGRTAPYERILAIVQGMAVCDLALADEALKRAADRGLGDSLSLFS